MEELGGSLKSRRQLRAVVVECERPIRLLKAAAKRDGREEAIGDGVRRSFHENNRAIFRRHLVPLEACARENLLRGGGKEVDVGHGDATRRGAEAQLVEAIQVRDKIERRVPKEEKLGVREVGRAATAVAFVDREFSFLDCENTRRGILNIGEEELARALLRQGVTREVQGSRAPTSRKNAPGIGLFDRDQRVSGERERARLRLVVSKPRGGVLQRTGIRHFAIAVRRRDAHAGNPDCVGEIPRVREVKATAVLNREDARVVVGTHAAKTSSRSR